MLKKLITAGISALAMLSPAAAQDERPDIALLFGEPAAGVAETPNTRARVEYWKKEVRRFTLSELGRMVWQPLFHCDYTTRTCRLGYTDNRGAKLFVVLADDRKTVLGHVDCRGIMCLQVEAGRVLVDGHESKPPWPQWYGYPLN